MLWAEWRVLFKQHPGACTLCVGKWLPHQMQVTISKTAHGPEAIFTVLAGWPSHICFKVLPGGTSAPPPNPPRPPPPRAAPFLRNFPRLHHDGGAHFCIVCYDRTWCGGAGAQPIESKDTVLSLHLALQTVSLWCKFIGLLQYSEPCG